LERFETVWNGLSGLERFGTVWNGLSGLEQFGTVWVDPLYNFAQLAMYQMMKSRVVQYQNHKDFGPPF
jgi:hypothetical protein